MPIFEYKGLDRKGKNVSGTIDAENMRVAKVKLKKDGIYVSKLQDKSSNNKKSNRGSKVSQAAVPIMEVANMTRQLATLIRANIPLVESLAAVSDQVEHPGLSITLSEIKNMVNEGATLNKSMAKYPKTFNRIFISMIEAGEASGTLEVILIRLAEFTESQSALNSKVKSAMLYPIIIFLISSLLLGAIFVFIIPKMVVIFESAPNLVLPWYSKVIIGISEFMVSYWHVLGLSIFLSYVFFKNWKSSELGEAQWHAIVLKLPVVGRLVRLVAVSRFSRTLSTLLNGGVAMLDAMGIVRNVVDNAVLARAIDAARDNISEGESIAGPLKKSKQFPPILIHMISIGEKTGELENMLTQVSDSYDFQVKTEVDGLTALLEPIMIVFMGCVIAAIVFAIMIPMFDMSDMGG